MSAVAYLAAIAAAELVAALVHPVWGFVAQIAILFSLLVHATLVSSPHHHRFLLSLALAPLTHIAATGLPLGFFPRQWWYLLTNLPLCAAALILIRVLPLTRQGIGWQLPASRSWPALGMLCLSGIALGVIGYQLRPVEPLVDSLSLSSIAVPATLVLLSTGVVEELLFRGILQATTTAAFGLPVGILYVSALYGILTIHHLSEANLLFVTGVALYFAEMVRRTRTLLGVALAHGLLNVTLLVILPLLPG